MTEEPDERLHTYGQWARIGEVVMRAGGSSFGMVLLYPRSDAEREAALRSKFIEVSPPDRHPPWFKVSADDVDAWYYNEVVVTWRGQTMHVIEDPDEFTGLVEIDYSSDPNFAAAQGWLGDRYSGWRAKIPFAEITDIEVKSHDHIARRDEIRERERQAANGKSRTSRSSTTGSAGVRRAVGAQGTTEPPSPEGRGSRLRRWTRTWRSDDATPESTTEGEADASERES
ncbi:hypothetical protein [Cellulomonas sp. P5_C5]